MAPPTLLPDSARAALDDAVQAVADAIRTSFTPREGNTIDPTTGTSVSNLAANRASKAAHAALSDALTAFVLTTNIDGTPLSTSSSASPSDTVLPLSTSSSSSASAPTSSSAPSAPAAPPPASSPPDPVVSLPPALEAILGSARFPGAPQQPLRRPPAAPALGPDALAALHAQAVSVLNIKALVPITLDVAAANFTRWRGLFLVALGKYALTDHVLSDDRRPDLAKWFQMDCVVLAWLYGSISADLLQEVMSHDATARSVWRALELQFLGNCEQRALNLTTEFRTFHQGDLSVNDYCRCMKTMADSLSDLGDPLSDRALVLATLNGLNEKFDTLRSLITMQRPFPSIADVRSQLLLEELSKAGRPSGQSTVLLAGATSNKPSSSPNPAHATGYDAGTSGGSGNASNNKNRRRRGGGGGGSNGNSGGNINAGSGMAGAPKGVAQGAPGQAGWPSPANPWAGTIHMWPGLAGRDLLGPKPVGAPFAGAILNGPPVGPVGMALVAYQATFPTNLPQAGVGSALQTQPSTPHGSAQPVGWFPGAPSQWDQHSLAGSFNTATLQQPPTNYWYMDTGATAHMTSDTGILSFTHPPTSRDPSHIVVGNGSSIPITAIGKTNLHHTNCSFTLNDILCSPAIIKNLISVRRFVFDNWCSVEFDPFGFTVKDLRTKTAIAGCNSSGPLYALHRTLPSSTAAAFTVATSTDVLWHRRLGHLGQDALARLRTILPMTKEHSIGLCHACQLSRNTRLPFTTSFTRASTNFELLHCDLWTSPIVSASGFKYYLVILDDCSHYVWTFPLRFKSETFSMLSHFFAYVKT